MRVLVIDNNMMPASFGAKDLAKFAARVPGATVEVRRAPHDDLPTDISRYDRVVISGSKTSAVDTAPWIDHLIEQIRRFVELKRPLLGVCYGHQMVARALGGINSVHRSDEHRAEFGWTKIEQTAPSELFAGLPETFYSFSSHFDEVHNLPKNFKPLARSELCPIQAFQVEELPVYGIQFHPERSLEVGEEVIARVRKMGLVRNFLNPDGGKKLFKKEVAETIFNNFFKLGNSK